MLAASVPFLGNSDGWALGAFLGAFRALVVDSAARCMQSHRYFVKSQGGGIRSNFPENFSNFRWTISTLADTEVTS